MSMSDTKKGGFEIYVRSTHRGYGMMVYPGNWTPLIPLLRREITRRILPSWNADVPFTEETLELLTFSWTVISYKGYPFTVTHITLHPNATDKLHEYMVCNDAEDTMQYCCLLTSAAAAYNAELYYYSQFAEDPRDMNPHYMVKALDEYLEGKPVRL